MTDLINGFMAPANRGSDFESAGAASRRLRGLQSEGASHADEATGSSRTEAPIDAFDYALGLGGQGIVDDAIAGNPGPEQFDYAELDQMKQTDKRWAWLEIDLSAIRHNVSQIRRLVGPRCQVMAVVKADAYGHGAVEVSKAALGSGASRLAVSSVPEAIELRRAGISVPLAILEQPPITAVPLLLAYDITPAIYEPDFAIAYGEAADLHGMTAPYHLAVNTGMNRLGVPFRDAVEFLRQVSFHRALQLEGVFTQFATAEVPETLDFQIQMNRFLDVLDEIRGAGFDPGIVHAANSAALCRFPQARFDMVRCGIIMYGIHPCEATREIVELRPAMSVHARIVDTHVVPVSEGVSYGMRYRSPGNVKICTLPIGYADGLSRILSDRIDFIMDGRYFRQVGDICMDQCMFEVDLRNRANLGRFNPQIGDEVIVVGHQGVAEITVDELAEKANTVPHEVLIGFAQRMPKVFV